LDYERYADFTAVDAGRPGEVDLLAVGIHQVE
jgi:hypothetical protein